MKKRKFRAILAMVMACTLLSGCVMPGPEEYVGGIVGGIFMAIGQIGEADSGEILAYEEDEESEYGDYSDFGDYDATQGQEASEETQSIAPEGDGAAQTIMVYMVGSDLESDYGNATKDLEEMMDAGVDTDFNNVLVYAGGASDWEIDGLSAEENTTLLLTDTGDFKVVDSHDSKSMGEAETLSSFINYCLENYEAESYGLVLWNHGAGPVYGFGVDENYKDILTVEEMQTAFDDSVGNSGERFEWVGFDACIMNSLEIADMLAPYSNYMIASQETEPGWGWDYGFLSEISNRAMSGDQIGKTIIDYYMDYGREMANYSARFYCDLTLSCVDLNKYQDVEDALNQCFGELDEGLTIETYPEMVRNRENTRDFGTYSSNFDYGMVDAIHLLNQIAPGSSAAAEAISAIEDMVVYSQSNMRNANGISICYPATSGEDYADVCVALNEGIDFSEEYTGFLKKYYSIQDGENFTGDWDFAKAKTAVVTMEAESEEEVDTSDISLQLTEEQQANYARGFYCILAKVKDAGYEFPEEDPRIDDMYMFIHLGRNVELDENGVLHGYYGNEVMYMHDKTEDTYSNIPMILMEQERTEEEVRYTCGTVLNNWNIEEDILNWRSQGANLQIVVNEEYPNGTIRSAVPTGTEDTNPSKQLLDLEDFGIMEIFARASYVTRDENGQMKQFYDWEESGWMLGFDQNLQNEYELEMRPLEDPENYVCMFCIKDVQGNMSYSELIPLK